MKSYAGLIVSKTKFIFFLPRKWFFFLPKTKTRAICQPRNGGNLFGSGFCLAIDAMLVNEQFEMWRNMDVCYYLSKSDIRYDIRFSLFV